MDRVPLEQLEQELEQELASGSLVIHFEAWRRADPALARFHRPADVLRYLRSRPSAAAEDTVLLALLTRARQEPSAGRLVLYALLPGLRNVARRSLVSVDEREELWAALLASVWEHIRAYPVERRPRRVAANLLLDTMRSTLAAVRRERIEDEPLPTALADEPSPELRCDDVDALLARAVAAGAISPQEAQLVLSTRFDGIPLAHVAAAHGEPYNRVKVRRQRAERRLLVWLGHRPVPRRPQKRPLSSARVVGTGS